jgi:hypothetical protein
MTLKFGDAIIAGWSAATRCEYRKDDDTNRDNAEQHVNH